MPLVLQPFLPMSQVNSNLLLDQSHSTVIPSAAFVQAASADNCDFLRHFQLLPRPWLQLPLQLRILPFHQYSLHRLIQFQLNQFQKGSVIGCQLQWRLLLHFVPSKPIQQQSRFRLCNYLHLIPSSFQHKFLIQ